MVDVLAVDDVLIVSDAVPVRVQAVVVAQLFPR